MTTKEAQQLYANLGRKAPAELIGTPVSKYHARAKMVEGHWFQSTSEALAYQVLRRWEQAGAISNLELQPRFVIVEGSRDAQTGRKVRARSYVGDFSFYRDGKQIVVDVKGFPTPLFLLKKRLFEVQYPTIPLEIWTRQMLKEMARQ